jgi:hypothetical protein
MTGSALWKKSRSLIVALLNQVEGAVSPAVNVTVEASPSLGFGKVSLPHSARE